MKTVEQEEAKEGVEQVKMLIVEEAEKMLQKFDLLTANEDLRNSMISYFSLSLNKLIFPDNPKTKAALEIVERNMILYMAEKPVSSKVILTNKK